MGGVRRDATRFRLLQPLSPEAMSRLPSEVIEVLDMWASEDVGHERADYLRWLELRALENGGAWADAVMASEDEPVCVNDLEPMAWQWIRRHAVEPFPVGRDCPELQSGMPAASLRELMPLSGVEYAALIEAKPDLRGKQRGGALLFMCKPVRSHYFDAVEIGNQTAYVRDGARVEIVPVPQRSISRATQTEARRAWREANGLPSGAGRHQGPKDWTDDKVVAAMLAYIKEHGGKWSGTRVFVMWAYERSTPEDEQPDGGKDEGVAAALGTRWGKRLGVPLDTLARELIGESGAIWVVDAALDAKTPT